MVLAMNTLLTKATTIDFGFNWVLLGPVLIVLLGAVLGLLWEALLPRGVRWSVQTVWTPLIIALAFLFAVYDLLSFPLNRGVSLVRGEIIYDGMGSTAQVVILLIGLLAVGPMIDSCGIGKTAFAAQPADIPGSFAEEQTEAAGFQRSEMLPLCLFSLGGMMLFPMANSLITLFVILEMISLPLYIMCAMARYRRLLSQESALKYFILGAYASGFFLMGATLLYGYSGSLQLSEIAMTIPYQLGSQVLLLAGLGLLLVGLLFKIGAAPFHAWTPDVYQGAPTPVTGFMAAGVKAAAFLALLRVYAELAAQVNSSIKPMLLVVALLTMAIGTLFGLVQKNIKRMLAYSSIAHAGFIMIALVPRASFAVGAMLFYLLAYGCATVGAFAIIYLVRKLDTDGSYGAEAQDLDSWAGIGKTNPVLAAAMMIFLLSFAGLPLTAGFMGKFLVFGAGLESGNTLLVVAAVVSSAITAFFYFRLGKIIYLDKPVKSVAVLPNATTTFMVVGLCVLFTLLLGIIPGPILQIMQISAIVIP